MRLFVAFLKLFFALGLIWVVMQIPTIIEKLVEKFMNHGEPQVAVVPPSSSMAANYNLLYAQERAKYEGFSAILFNCLRKIEDRYKLDLPNGPDKIHSAHVSDRVRFDGSHYIYRYDVKRQEAQYGGGMQREDNAPSAKDIKNILRENLPNYLENGYGYSGNIYVSNLDDTHISIEIVGVRRNLDMEDWGC